jgi:hypothetical protein
VEFDEDYLFVIYSHHARSDNSTMSFLQIYARNNGSCLWTCNAATLSSINATLNFESPGRVRSQGDCNGSSWCLWPTKSVPVADQLEFAKYNGLYAVRYDEHSASLLVLGRRHLYILLDYKAKCRAAVATGRQDTFDVGSSLTAVSLDVGPYQKLAGQLAVYDGRAAFVVGVSRIKATQQRLETYS